MHSHWRMLASVIGGPGGCLGFEATGLSELLDREATNYATQDPYVFLR